MPWTLYRYILRELLKVLVLTTSVLVVVLSFGAAIGPMSDGLLGPMMLVKFVIYTMPTVLGFALPFSGAFSATVVFHGMTKDNEILACRACGMSYSRILTPVMGLGVALMLVLLLLSNTIVPGFWKAAKQTVQGDVLGVLVSQLNQNRPYILGDAGMVLYADAAETRDPPPGSSVNGFQAIQLIVMKNVAVGQYDKQTKRVINDTTASSASAMLVRDSLGKSYITLRLIDPIYYEAVDGQVQRVGQSGDIETDRPILLPDPLEDEAVFYSYQDLMSLKRNPHDFDLVRQAQADLAATVSRQQLSHLIEEALKPDDAVVGSIMLKGGLENSYFLLSAPPPERTARGLALKRVGQDKVTIDRYDNPQLRGEPSSRFEAESAELVLRSGTFDNEPEVQVTLRNVRVLGLNNRGAVNNKEEYILPAMRHTEQVLGVDPATLSPEELNEWSQRDTIRSAAGVEEGRANLRFRILQLKYMIDAELYTRFANALATPLLLLLGTLLAIRLHDKLPLVVFFWAFLLAIVTLIMIRTGSSMAERVNLVDVQRGVTSDRMIGVAVLWGGNLMLLFVVARLYLRVARN